MLKFSNILINMINFYTKNNLLSSKGFWQVLLDKDRNPATKPPWGGLAKIDLVTGKIIWDVPFGKEEITKKYYCRWR